MLHDVRLGRNLRGVDYAFNMVTRQFDEHQQVAEALQNAATNLFDHVMNRPLWIRRSVERLIEENRRNVN